MRVWARLRARTPPPTLLALFSHEHHGGDGRAVPRAPRYIRRTDAYGASGAANKNFLDARPLAVAQFFCAVPMAHGKQD